VKGDPEKGVDICVVNTCAFTGQAREESADSIIELAELKKRGRIGFLVIAGCLPQFYKGALSRELPEADLTVGTGDFKDIAGLVSRAGKGGRFSYISRHLDYLYDGSSPRASLTPRHYRYIKIAEGCSNRCSYCVISRLKGEFRGRTIPSVVEEVKKARASGALKEINLIGQDTTMFGLDKYGKPALAKLLRSLCALKGGPAWIRVLYTHPAHYTDELIDTIAGEDKVCKYLDIPVQHISGKILRKMNRNITSSGIISLIDKLRKRVPGIRLRTSIIVGFPGESERDFKELLDFVRSTRFDRLGAFLYSREEGTAAASFKGQVPEDVKQGRFDELMKLQQGISRRLLSSFLGKRIEVLVDEKDAAAGKDRFIARTQYDAPEVDGAVYVSGALLRTGEFCKVDITDTLEYDLVGEA
jgi:ribosomal protein S12 methylthiotransferase